MPRKGEKLSAEHKAKMMAGRVAKTGASATSPARPMDGERLANKRKPKGSFEATKPLISEGQVPNLTKKKLGGACGGGEACSSSEERCSEFW